MLCELGKRGVRVFWVYVRERWLKVQGVYMAQRKVGWGVGCNRREVREEAELAGANSFTCFHRCLSSYS